METNMLEKLRNATYSTYAKNRLKKLAKRKQGQDRTKKENQKNEQEDKSQEEQNFVQELTLEEILMMLEGLNQSSFYKDRNLTFSYLKEDEVHPIHIHGPRNEKENQLIQKLSLTQLKKLYRLVEKNQVQETKGTLINVSC